MVECLDKDEVVCCYEDVVACLDEGVLCHAWIVIIGMILMLIFSLHTPWNRFLRKPWVENV